MRKCIIEQVAEFRLLTLFYCYSVGVELVDNLVWLGLPDK